MLDRHQRELPDLSRHAALFPGAGVIPRFRAALLAAARERGYGGVLAPWCGTLDKWLQLQANDGYELVDESARELLLLEALESFPRLRERYGTWALVDSLLALFDELNAEHPEPPQSAEELAALLAAGYRVKEPLPPLQEEARLVHALWSAWNAHLASRRLRDRALARRAALAQSRLPTGTAYHIYVLGAVAFAGAEAQWLQARLREGSATVLLHGSARASGYHPDGALQNCLRALGVSPPPEPPPSAPYTRLLEAVYADERDIGARARGFAAEIASSPLRGRLTIYAAADFEEEARAVDLAVRRWRAAGVTQIGIVTPDRKLARRVRALLERANLGLRDTAGWALSTTSAATAVMRWLECVEQDFAQAPLLDFLKSPFVSLGFPRPRLEALVHAFEERIVRRHNVSSGLDDYRRALRARTESGAGVADEAPAVSGAALALLLDRLADAAAPLARLLGARPRPPLDYLAGLERSLARTGLLDSLGADAAGVQLLAAVRPPGHRHKASAARLRWSEFHHWLRRELERRRFHPPLPTSGIELLDLAESRLRLFGALIVAGCTREHLPGAPAGSPFFNDGVRASLGLPTREERLLAPLHDFRRLLEAAPRVLLTWRRFEEGEAVVPSPWTERLVAFHRLAYGSVPEDTELRHLLAAPQTALYRRAGAPLPEPAVRPAPRLPATRVPAAISASAHQRLLDCPYQFYAAEGLGLQALDEVREEMEKSDYGRGVHRILHAFHTGVPGLPGPWAGGASGAANRAQATALLAEIGRRVFGYDSDKRFSTRGWRHRWERFIAAYLDWQENRAHQWQVEATEQTLERALAIGGRTITLKGRADRIDRGPAGAAIVDYKTGAVPESSAIASGEQAQLPFYALLCAGPIAEVTYAQLTPEAVKTVSLAGEELAQVVARLEERLRALLANIDRGAPLPAWGDPTTCRYCRYEGLCRKEMWATESSSTPLPLPSPCPSPIEGEGTLAIPPARSPA